MRARVQPELASAPREPVQDVEQRYTQRMLWIDPRRQEYLDILARREHEAAAGEQARAQGARP